MLRTRARGTASGTEIRVNGGVVESETEAGSPEGTRIDIEDLFYNLPARRKFLKSDAAEAAQISRIVTQLALGAYHVGFSLVAAGRRVLECPPAATRIERLFQVYGDVSDLIEVRRETGGVSIAGYIAPLAETGPRRGPRTSSSHGRLVRTRRSRTRLSTLTSVASSRSAARGAPLHRDAARRGRRERAPHESGGAVSRAVAGARGGPPRLTDALGQSGAPALT